jgi:hypothetical protein
VYSRWWNDSDAPNDRSFEAPRQTSSHSLPKKEQRPIVRPCSGLTTRFEPGTYTTATFVHDHWEHALSPSPPIIRGDDAQSNRASRSRHRPTPRRPLGVYYSPFKSERGRSTRSTRVRNSGCPYRNPIRLTAIANRLILTPDVDLYRSMQPWPRPKLGAAVGLPARSSAPS